MERKHRDYQAILHKKTRIMAAVVVLTNVGGNVLLSQGMKEVGQTVTASVLPYIRAMANPWVAGGIFLLIMWLVSELTLLSWADLSYVLPITSVSYVLTAIIGKLALHEYVSLERWVGIGLIAIGVVVVGQTHPATHHQPPAP
jgi:uncharacterized membrane protein